MGDWVSPLAPHVSEPCNPLPSSSFPVQKESGFFFKSVRGASSMRAITHEVEGRLGLELRLTHNARRRAWYGGTYSAKGAADSVAPHDRWASR